MFISVSASAAPVSFQVADSTGLVLEDEVDPEADSRWTFRTETYGVWSLWATHQGRSVCFAVRPRRHGPMWDWWVRLAALGSEDDPVEPYRLDCIPVDNGGQRSMHMMPPIFAMTWWNAAEVAPTTVTLPDPPGVL